MDPLSITASIFTVLQATTTLLSYGVNVLKAKSDQRKLVIEARNLQNLLIDLRYRVEDAKAGDVWFDHVRRLGATNGPLEQFQHVLEKMVKQITVPGKPNQIIFAMKWPWSKLEVYEALHQMEKLQPLIDFALSNDTFRLALAIQSEVTQLNSKITAVQEGVDNLDMQASRDLQDQLSRWLQLPDPSSNFQDALEKRCQNTGSWLLRSSYWQEWKCSNSSLLWLHGKAGCGKTVLSATALENIRGETKYQSDVAVAYFYFDFHNAKKQCPSAAARSLLFQLSCQQEDNFSALKQAYQQHDNGREQPSSDTVLDLLNESLHKLKQTYIVLDAIDECTDWNAILSLVHNLTMPQRRGLYMLITSRREKDIEDKLSPIANCIINIRSAKVDKDIRLFAQNRLANDEKFSKWSSEIRNEILNELMKKADGMFQWADYQLKALGRCVNLSGLRKALSSLPKDLEETYARVIDSLKSGDNFHHTITVLRWLCYSNRPLSLAEVAEIIAIKHSEDDGAFVPEDRLPDPNDVLTICSSLITCHDNQLDHTPVSDYPSVESINTEGNGDTQFQLSSVRQFDRIEVRLAHSSVKEYLLSDHCYLRAELLPEKCHDLMAAGCLHYLHYVGDGAPQNDSSIAKYALIDYAARDWWVHARYAGNMLRSATVMLARDLFLCEATLLTWVYHYNIDKPERDYKPPLSTDNLAPPLYYAASCGISGVAEEILQLGVDVNAQGGRFGNALQAASMGGHEKMVQILIYTGADVNTTGGEYSTALQAASNRGQEKVVQILLDAGADVKAEGRLYGNALQAASRGGHWKVVQMLLRARADVNRRGGYYGTALQAAARGGHEMVTQILMKAGADVNIEAGAFGTALQAAANGGNEQVVRVLIEAGADVNAVGGDYGTALQAAADNGHVLVVQMLMDAGADMNLVGGLCGTALQAASDTGHEQVVQMLIRAGANINIEAGLYGTALQAASDHGHERVVQMLIDAGANVNIRGGLHGSALKAASENGRKKVVRMLIKAGAEELKGT